MWGGDCVGVAGLFSGDPFACGGDDYFLGVAELGWCPCSFACWADVACVGVSVEEVCLCAHWA